MKKQLAFLSTAFFLFSLTTETRAQSDTTFVIKGKIDTVPKAVYYILYNKGDTFVEDTITLDSNRRFEYQGNLTEPTRFFLSIENTYNPLWAGDFTVYEFWIEPGKIMDFYGKSDWLVMGTKGLINKSDNYHLTHSETEILSNEHGKQYSQAISKYRNQGNRPLADEMRERIGDSVAIEFIKKHPTTYYSVYLLHNMLRSDNPDYGFIEASISLFPEKIRNSFRGREVAQSIVVNNVSAIGKVMPDFEQPDTSDRLVKLSDFRGKYLFVDFWASWCGPCREENPHFVDAYKTFGARGFDMLSVSLDESKERWLTAIQQDKLSYWTHVSDLKGFDNSVAKYFFIYSIPDNFLLDPDGKILARNLSGTELIEQLQEIFKE